LWHALTDIVTDWPELHRGYKALNVVAEIDMAGKVVFALGPDPSVHAYSRVTVQRNLFQIPLE
jgi:hypothetical protein